MNTIQTHSRWVNYEKLRKMTKLNEEQVKTKGVCQISNLVGEITFKYSLFPDTEFSYLRKKYVWICTEKLNDEVSANFPPTLFCRWKTFYSHQRLGFALLWQCGIPTCLKPVHSLKPTPVFPFHLPGNSIRKISERHMVFKLSCLC